MGLSRIRHHPAVSTHVPRLPGPAVLFCPGDRPDRFDKALAAADAVILDLEDAVSPDRKQLARRTVCEALAGLPAERVVVRINPPRTEEGRADLAALREAPLRFVMVPKAERPEDIQAAAPLSVVALCESARGVLAAPTLAATEGCVALMWGGEDLTADVGGLRSRGPDGNYLPLVQHARTAILLAAAAAGRPAWDGVYLDIGDLDGLAAESREAVLMGFAVKVAIHPSQATVIRDAYRPSPDQIEWARKVVDAARSAPSGVISLDGQMIDGPLIAMAEGVLLADREPAPQVQ